MSQKKPHRHKYENFDREIPMGYYCECGKRENEDQEPKVTKEHLEEARRIVDSWIKNPGIAGEPDLRTKIANAIAAKEAECRKDERESCIRAICKYCDLKRPLIGDIHTWQVLTCKDKKGNFIYNPVQEKCLSTAIRNRK